MDDVIQIHNKYFIGKAFPQRYFPTRYFHGLDGYELQVGFGFSLTASSSDDRVITDVTKRSSKKTMLLAQTFLQGIEDDQIDVWWDCSFTIGTSAKTLRLSDLSNADLRIIHPLEGSATDDALGDYSTEMYKLAFIFIENLSSTVTVQISLPGSNACVDLFAEEIFSEAGSQLITIPPGGLWGFYKATPITMVVPGSEASAEDSITLTALVSGSADIRMVVAGRSR